MTFTVGSVDDPLGIKNVYNNAQFGIVFVPASTASTSLSDLQSNPGTVIQNLINNNNFCNTAPYNSNDSQGRCVFVSPDNYYGTTSGLKSMSLQCYTSSGALISPGVTSLLQVAAYCELILPQTQNNQGVVMGTWDAQSAYPGTNYYVAFYNPSQYCTNCNTGPGTYYTDQASVYVNPTVTVSPASIYPASQVAPGSDVYVNAFFTFANPSGTLPPAQCGTEGNYGNCPIIEFTPNSYTTPCVSPLGLINSGNPPWCVTSVALDGAQKEVPCLFSAAGGNAKINEYTPPGITPPYLISITTDPAPVSAINPHEMFCVYYSPDYNMPELSGNPSTWVAQSSPYPGIWPDYYNLSLQVGGSSTSGGMYLNVAPNPAVPNTLVTVTSSPQGNGCSTNSAGVVVCPTYYTEIAPMSGQTPDCVQPTPTTPICSPGAAPDHTSLSAMLKANNNQACVLEGPQTAYQYQQTFTTDNTPDGTSIGICTFLPSLSLSASQTLQVSTSGGSGGGGGGAICPPGTNNPACISGSQPPVNIGAATNAICSVYFIINTVLFILALTIMIIGGAVYAGANVLPGSTRGVIQGYAMGMVMGGVVGAIIAVVAPWVLQIIIGSPSLQSIITAACP
jgi:hypothetical protein